MTFPKHRRYHEYYLRTETTHQDLPSCRQSVTKIVRRNNEKTGGLGIFQAYNIFTCIYSSIVIILKKRVHCHL